MRSIIVPTDEMCFVLCDAESAESVKRLGKRAELSFDRAVEAHEDT